MVKTTKYDIYIFIIKDVDNQMSNITNISS